MIKKNMSLAVIIVFIIMLFVPALNTSAQDPGPWAIEVNDTRDLNDYGHNDVCDAVYGNVGEQCTLRAAIFEANLCSGSLCEEGVIIKVPPGTYTLTIPPSGDNNNSTGDLDISPNNRGAIYLIEGTDAANPPIIDANGLDRVFRIDNSDNTIILRNLIIRGGKLAMTNADPSLKIGAGISNQGILSLENVVIEDNQIICALTDTAGCYQGEGGGVFSGNQITMNTTTIRNNTAIRGGGIFYNGWAQMKIFNSTISGNEGVGSSGGIENYGPLFIQNSTISNNTADSVGGIGNWQGTASMELYNVTITSNTATSGSAANVFNLGTVRIRNSIIAYPISSLETMNCLNYSNWYTSGTNLFSDSSCGTGADILSNTDPKLTPLAWLGGPTMTRGLLKGSPAHNAGPSFCYDSSNIYVITSDQRGANRDVHCDLGAFEGEAFGVYLPIVRR